jgi:hypothetical protein
VDESPLFGTLEHGYYDDIRLGADFFSGHLIHMAKDGNKSTDLVAKTTEPLVDDGPEAVTVKLRAELGIGTLWKTYHISKTGPEVSVTYKLKVNGLTASSLRLGIFTLIPSAFELDSLWFETVNGGAGAERFTLKGHLVSQDDSVSQRVTASGCLGATEGWVRVGDKDKCLEFSTDKSELFTVPMLRFSETGNDEKPFFLRLLHSLGEVDDTAWWVWRGYNEVTFKIRGRRS